jgi:hypothetical protein
MMKNWIKETMKGTTLIYAYIFLNNYYYKKNYKRRMERRYKRIFGIDLDLEEPKTFSEKIQWLKLFYCPKNENVILAGDKLGLHEFLERKELSYLKSPIIQVYSSVEELDWKELPEKFVIKKSNASGLNLIVKDKRQLREECVKRQLKGWMNLHFGYIGGEVHYEKMQSRIIVEHFIEDISEEFLFHCTDGEAIFFQKRCTVESHHKSAKIGRLVAYHIYTDMDGRIIDLKGKGLPHKLKLGEKVELPREFTRMKELAGILSQGFPYVRVDFYIGDGKLILGEMTFTPTGGFYQFAGEMQDRLGKSIVLTI